MWNEHFGIGIVEMMAAGLIVVAHNSGGPKSDIIIDDDAGFLASTDAEYADFINKALTMSPDQAERIRTNARESAKRFSDEVFAKSFEKAVVESGFLEEILKSFDFQR